MEYETFAGLFGPWADMFRPFIEGEEMFKIYQKLKEGKEIIVPSWDNTYRAFAKTHPDTLKVVWYLMD